jgi:hypothetical protein
VRRRQRVKNGSNRSIDNRVVLVAQPPNNIFDRLLPVGRIQISFQQTGPPVSKRLVEVPLRVVGAR